MIEVIENITENQLKTLTGIVYMIKNIINNKVYIGKTEKRFIDRYWAGRWWKYPANTYLKNSVNKYGLENFKISILAYSISDKKELINIESNFIKQYNSLYPNGYNFLEESQGVRNFTDEMRINLSIAGCKGKTYKIKEIATGEIKEFRCTLEIMNKYGMPPQNLDQVIRGKRRTTHGICLPETNSDKFYEFQELRTIIDQFNKKYKFYNICKFERENNCTRNSILRVILKKSISTISKNGIIFRLESTPIDDSQYLKSCGQSGNKYKQIVLTRIEDNLDFVINIPQDIKNFCSNNNIKQREIYALTTNKQFSAKGFKLKNIIYAMF